MYYTPGSYDPANTRRFSRKKEGGPDTGRTGENSLLFRDFLLDIDGGPYKWRDAIAKGRSTDALYETAKEIAAAANQFIKDSGVSPTYIVETGSGGLQLHYVLSESIGRDEWLPRAERLVELTRKHSLKIDAPVTTNAAGLARAPGSIHQKSGRLVKAHSLGVAPFTLEKWDKKTGFDPATVSRLPASRSRARLADSINSDVLDSGRSPYSYKQAAQFCGAMRKAAERNGRDTPYPVWILAIRTAAMSIEGEDYAHEISIGHDDYNHGETDNKLASLTGGPASCAAWRAAYGSGGPCDRCEYGEF